MRLYAKTADKAVNHEINVLRYATWAAREWLARIEEQRRQVANYALYNDEYYIVGVRVADVH